MEHCSRAKSSVRMREANVFSSAIMPSIDSWQELPLSLIQTIFEKRTDQNWINQVLEHFETLLKSSENSSAVPSLNDFAAHELRPNSLVRFRCMIQDSFDNEYFLHKYNLVDKEKGVTVQKTSCFQDVVDGSPNCEIDADLSTSNAGMRQVLYCVSVPGETDWVKEAWKSNHSIKLNKLQTKPYASSAKRERDDSDDDDDDGDDDNMVVEDHSTSSSSSPDSNKKTKAEANQKDAVDESSVRNSTLNRNHPLPDENGPVCLVKVYSEDEEFKINQVIEFFGVLSVDPGLSSVYDGATGDADKMDATTLEEDRARHPPASLVPRLHVVSMKRLAHNNPLLPPDMTPEFKASVQKEASALRGALLGLLEKATFGDTLAAEYLLLHLLSRVYIRRGMTPVGKFSLNISGIPPNSSYPRVISHFLKELLSKLHYLPMSIGKFNTLRFVPVKNYATNRLDTGMLQLSDGTQLILDETTLEPGTMDANGVKNIQALKDILNFQRINYNFQFHELPFDCDIRVLIFSEGKSMLPCDCQIELKPKNAIPENVEEYFATFCSKCPTEFLDKSRKYLSTARLLDYQLSEDVTKTIQEDFVNARREDARIGANDLHAWLVLARLMSVSVGQQSATIQRWERAKALETQRKELLTGGRNANGQNGH